MKRISVIAAFALSGCAAANMQPSIATQGAPAANAPAHFKKNARLVYATDYANNTLTFYSYTTGKKEGTINGLSAPQGLCSDANGNVFVANTDGNEVLGFSLGSTTSSRTITTTGQYPGGCAVSSKGTLAVVALCSAPSCGEGGLLLYADETGSPTTVTCQNLYHYYYATYDGKGNLFVEGDNVAGDFGFCEVRKGGTQGIAITLNFGPAFPSPVHWDGKYIATTYANGDIIGRYTIKGTSGTLENTVTLNGAQGQFTMASKKVVLAATAGGYGYWKYPTGGNPYKTQQLTSDEFGGMVVSPAPQL